MYRCKSTYEDVKKQALVSCHMKVAELSHMKRENLAKQTDFFLVKCCGIEWRSLPRKEW